MSAAQVLRQAEELKSAAADTSKSANEVWMSRQALQDIYQKLLVMDLEYALDKKVEQDLWNHAFKKQISTLQNQTKDKQNQKRAEVQASLNLFLEAASGFYLQLLQEMCSAFRLDLPFRKRSSALGIMKEYGPVAAKIKTPKKSSCMYICQDCLVHLGDIARYRQQIDQAQAYYRHAARLVPYNGQPYNQLAILEAQKGNKLSTVFFHIRSIAVKHPFPVATTNLEKFYAKISKDGHEYRQKLTVNELISVFLQLHAYVHLCMDLNKARSRMERVLGNLMSNVISNSFSSYQLVQIVAVNLYALYHTKRKLNNNNTTASDDGKVSDDGGSSSGSDNLKAYHDLLFDVTVSMFEQFLQATNKQDSKNSHTLAPIKVLLDWLRTDPECLSNPALKKSIVWSHLSKLLNNLQMIQTEPKTEIQKYMALPLPEDCDLECFIPVSKAHSELDFYLVPPEALNEEMELKLRCQKMINGGFWIAEEFPSLNLLNVQAMSSGRLQFSSQIKPGNGLNGDGLVEQKTTRQNVAIQAIMQKGNRSTDKDCSTSSVDKKRLDDVTNRSTGSSSVKFQKTNKSDNETVGPETLDAGVMAHTMKQSEGTFQKWFGPPERHTGERNQDALAAPSNDMNHTTGFHANPLPATTTFPYFMPSQQQPPLNQGNTAIFRPILNMPTDQRFSRHPVPQQPHSAGQGGVIGQRFAFERDSMAVNSNSVGGGGQMLGSDEPMGYDSFGNIYSNPAIRGFMPREAIVPGQQGQNNFFRIGQPLSFPVPPPIVYFQRPDGPRGQPPPLAIPQSWSGEEMAHHMPYQIHPTMSDPPPPMDFSAGRPNQPQFPFPPLSQSQVNQLPSDQDHLSDNQSPVGRERGMFMSGYPPPSSQHQVESPKECGTYARLGYPMAESQAGVGCQSPRFAPQEHQQQGMFDVAGGDILGVGQVMSAQQQPGFYYQNPRHMEIESKKMSKEINYKPQDAVHQSSYVTSQQTMNYSRLVEDNQKPDSPQPIGTRTSNPLLMSSRDGKKDQSMPPATNMYTLFSQSPWPVGISKVSEGNSRSSSNFGSSNCSSLRATPDPEERLSISSGGGYRMPYFARPPSASVDGPWNTPSIGTAPQLSMGSGNLMINNLQPSMWTSGPSPLEKLLEQQKQQRQSEPR